VHPELPLEKYTEEMLHGGVLIADALHDIALLRSMFINVRRL
jgi:hypothetical protein